MNTPNKSAYKNAFYKERHAKTIYAAECVLKDLFSNMPTNTITSMIDIGCGVGTWLYVAKSLGVETIHGVEGDWVRSEQLEIPSTCFEAHDFTLPYSCEKKFDLAICLEVAEHLKESNANSFVDSICSTSKLVLFSAAIPWQKGVNHFNEQWPEYWAEKFRLRGYTIFDGIRQKFWNQSQIPLHYRQNIFFCAKDESIVSYINGNSQYYRSNTVLPLVHPELYTDYMRDRECFQTAAAIALKAAQKAVQKRLFGWKK